ICTAQIVETVPWIDAKYYASTQVMDEARHVEVFHRYLDEKLSGHYPINAHLKALLDDIIADSRWDMTYLGMQIMVEGLALAAFGFIHQLTTEPLLKQLLRYVMSDEARHVAFGVLSLKEVYDGMNASEIRERQEVAFEAVSADRAAATASGRTIAAAGPTRGSRMAVDEAEIRSGTIDELARMVTDEEKREAIRAVRSNYDTLFTWNYEKGARPALNKL